MSEQIKLAPCAVTDSAVLAQCVEAMNKWSQKLPFGPTKALGTDTSLVSAKMYHTYGLSIDTDYAHREFVLEKGGKPMSNPKDIKEYDLWKIVGVQESGDAKKELPDTCYKEECDKCNGDGKTTCDECNGDGKVTCSKCDGAGQVRCSKCRGSGEVACSCKTISGLNSPKVCPKCHNSGTVRCTSCHGSGEVRCSKCGGRGEVKCDKCGGKGEIVCENCEGRGWNSFTYHLVQKQKTDNFRKVWKDDGFAGPVEFDKCEKHPAKELYADNVEGADKRVSAEKLPTLDCGFSGEVKPTLIDNSTHHDEEHEVRLQKQKASLRQFDSAILYEYKYKDGDYRIWIDLATGSLFESGDGALMTSYWFEANKKRFPKKKVDELMKMVREASDDKIFSVKVRRPGLMWLLAISPLGWFGFDRFALGQAGMGCFKLLCFGGFGLVALYDALFMPFVAKKGNMLRIMKALGKADPKKDEKKEEDKKE